MYKEKDNLALVKKLSELLGKKFVFGSPWLYNSQVRLRKPFKRHKAAHSEKASSNVTKYHLAPVW